MPKKKYASGVNRGSKRPGDKFALAGFYRVNIVDPDGTIQGDSGWVKNTITSNGLNYYIMGNIVRANSSYSVGRMILASASDLTSIIARTGTNEYVMASTLTTSNAWASVASTTSARSASNSSATMRFSAAYPSGTLYYPCTIAAVGLAQDSTIGTTAAAGIMCAGSFASSTVSSNQAVNVTYDVYFSA